jgi:predicted nuclease of predicted toxin-antitoxin system
MRFLVDAQLPPALARMLAAKGFDAEHVHDLQLGEADDGAIWDHAAQSGAAIVTKDEDFVSLITLHPDGPPIVWIRIGNTSKQALLRWFEPLIPEIVAAIGSGEKLIEVV